MTPEERIDAALESVLKASGLSLKNFTNQKTIDRMREAMRKVMSEAYIEGSNDNFKAGLNYEEARHGNQSTNNTSTNSRIDNERKYR